MVQIPSSYWGVSKDIYFEVLTGDRFLQVQSSYRLGKVRSGQVKLAYIERVRLGQVRLG